MKPTIYIETTIPSYLTAWPSRDLIRAAHQQLTREWWERRAAFDLHTSQLVLDECQAGDPAAAEARLLSISDLPLLDMTSDVTALARALLHRVGLPAKAASDAFHIAFAAVHGVHYLLTWNCRHIGNAVFRPRVEAVCREEGFEPPTICNPGELPAQEARDD